MNNYYVVYGLVYGTLVKNHYIQGFLKFLIS